MLSHLVDFQPTGCHFMVMRKIYLDLPKHICDAVAFNLAGYELVEDAAQAEYSPNCDDLRQGKLRLGILLDRIARDFGSSFEIDSLKFDLKAQIAELNGKVINLTEKEQGLIEFLHSHNGYVEREKILQHVWKYSANTNTRTLESHVHRLNQKFEDEFGIRLIEHKDGSYKLY